MFRTQAGLNKSRKKKGITTISRKRYNLKKSNDFRHKDSSLGKTYIMYTSDSNGFNSYNQDFTISKNRAESQSNIDAMAQQAQQQAMEEQKRQQEAVTMEFHN